MSNKTEHFSYKGGCGVCERMRINWKRLKEELAWAIDERLHVISNKMLFKHSYTTKKLKNKVLKQYYMHYYVTLSNVF